MIVGIQNEILKIHSLGLLKRLLEDKTTRANIIWATDAYKDRGTLYERDQEIKIDLITGANSDVVKNRARKEMEHQAERTRQHAEVFTPLWICKLMNECTDDGWFDDTNPHPFDGQKSVKFKDNIIWQKYVDSRILEITCGEAPYLVSRYDVSNGESIPVAERIGILDRKLRVVNENAQSEEEWLEWATRAFQATYGYEFQGDNVLIARVNLLMTFEEYMEERWKRKPNAKEYQAIANIIAWNIWQMDGLTETIPYCKAEEEAHQLTLFEFLNMETDDSKEKNEQPLCEIYNWRSGYRFRFSVMKERSTGTMKFDFIIGNPPYQDETIGENETYAPPIYNKFMDATYELADKVELVHPARFLFNAGSTPKAWNQKILSDPHFKVLHYEANSSNIFSNTDIKGGIVISYHDMAENFGAIEIFTPYDELNSILQKVRHNNFVSFSTIIVTSYAYHFLDNFYEDHPELKGKLSKGHEYDFKSNVFEKMPEAFLLNKPNDGTVYARILGRADNERAYRYIDEKYINEVVNLHSYKVFLPGATGTGQFGETIAPPLIGEPEDGSTETFLSIGILNSLEEAENVVKYIKSKFARAMFGILKRTQANTPGKWQWVPLQEFTKKSDIEWSKSVAEIDQQLYRKYGLTDSEIEFIENNVKEMN